MAASSDANEFTDAMDLDLDSENDVLFQANNGSKSNSTLATATQLAEATHNANSPMALIGKHITFIYDKTGKLYDIVESQSKPDGTSREHTFVFVSRYEEVMGIDDITTQDPIVKRPGWQLALKANTIPRGQALDKSLALGMMLQKTEKSFRSEEEMSGVGLYAWVDTWPIDQPVIID